MTPRERAEATRKLLDVIQYDYSKLNIYEFHKRREDVIEAAIAEHVRALLAPDDCLVREACKAHFGPCSLPCPHPSVDCRVRRVPQALLAALRRKALGE